MDPQRLQHILDLLVADGTIHPGNRQDVLNRGRDQARHILLDKRAQMRRMLGRDRVTYRVTEIELISSFRFRRVDEPDERVTEELITRRVATDLDLQFVYLDPLALDYQLVTKAFGGPFAERHLIVAMEDDAEGMTIAMADPWDTELVESSTRLHASHIIAWIQPSNLSPVLFDHSCLTPVSSYPRPLLGGSMFPRSMT